MIKHGRGIAVAVSAVLVLAACSGDDDDGGASLTTTPDVTTPLVTSPNGEPVREGDWEEIASSDDGGVAWTLSRAPAAGGGVCWRLETDPELDLVTQPEHCNSPLPPEASRVLRMDFPYASGITTDHDIVVGVLPEEIVSAEFGFSDGTLAEPTYLDKEGGIVVWSGPSRPAAAAVTIELTDGVEVGCGPGDVVSPLELTDLPDERLIDARQFVWTCFEN